jgi:hypothetical protein
MRANAVISAAALVAWAAGCAGNALVRADDMSAAQHRSEAEREQGVSAREIQRGANPPPTDPGAYDPNEEHRRKAEESSEHARQHSAAAKFLEQFESDECAGVPATSRAACPLLGPLVSLDDIPGGVRATFVDRSRVRPAIAAMRCHYAYARARHFDESVACPLYVRGIEVRPGLDPRSVEIVGRDDRTVRLIRERSREQAMLVRRNRR